MLGPGQRLVALAGSQRVKIVPGAVGGQLEVAPVLALPSGALPGKVSSPEALEVKLREGTGSCSGDIPVLEEGTDPWQPVAHQDLL